MTLNIAEKINEGPSSGWASISLAYNFLYTFTLADFTTNTNPPYSDPEGDALEFVKVTALPAQGQLLLSAVPVIVNQEISSADLVAGNFKYQADVADTDGYIDAVMMFTVSDVGSSTFSVTSQKVTLTVDKQENQPPSEVGDGSMDLEYGETGVFTTAMFTTGATPPYADPEGDPALNLKITGLPVLGEILLDGIPVLNNQIISFEDIQAGLLTYVPDLADTDGDLQGFTFEIADSGSSEFIA